MAYQRRAPVAYQYSAMNRYQSGFNNGRSWTQATGNAYGRANYRTFQQQGGQAQYTGRWAQDNPMNRWSALGSWHDGTFNYDKGMPSYMQQAGQGTPARTIPTQPGMTGQGSYGSGWTPGG